MKKFAVLSVLALMIFSAISFDAQSQDKKPTAKEKRASQKKEKIESVIKMIEAKSFKFNVYSIDESSVPGLSSYQLKGGYMLTVKGDLLTVNLPVMGKSASRGGAADWGEDLKLTSMKYNIEMSIDQYNNLIAKIKFDDQSSTSQYTFVLYVSDKETMTVLAPGMDKITYKGHFAAIKQ